MSDSRINPNTHPSFFNENKDVLFRSGASITIAPFWFWLYGKSLRERANILNPSSIGQSHSTLFSKIRTTNRGLLANLFTMQPLVPACDCMLTRLLNKLEEISERKPNTVEKFSAAFVTGATSVILANPYETVLISAQKHHISPFESFKQILKGSGIKGLYSGAIPMLLRNGNFFGGVFVTTPELKKYFEKQLPGTGPGYTLVASIGASVISAGLFTAVVVPFDISAIMAQSDPAKKIFKSPWEAAQLAYKQHGLPALKTGTILRLAACTIEMLGFSLLPEVFERVLEFQPRGARR